MIKMNTSPRFDRAIAKLYEAFHADSLNPLCCNQCAVGNICDGKDFWKHMAVAHGSTKLSYVGQVNEAFGKRFFGFTPSELLRIESVFLEACGFQLPIRLGSRKPEITKDVLFRGLMATVSLLCELEDIPDIFDCSKLFDFEVDDSKTTPFQQELALVME